MSEQPSLITKIGLNKLFLWMEAERLETYPESFAKLKSDQTYSKETLVEIFGLIYKEGDTSSHPVRSDFLRNLYGLEVAIPTKVLIRGVNALQETEAGVYKPTAMAIEIGQAYLRRDEPLWTSGLAKMIACHEVRTRLMLYLLGKAGGRLVFSNGDFFGARSGGAEVFLANGNKVALFADGARGFNELLQTYSWNALGPWWVEEIRSKGLGIANDFIFEGLREPRPSTNKLNSRLKSSLFLMKYLGILESQADEWVVNPIQAAAILGEEIAQDFVVIEFDHSPIQRLQQWHDAIRDELGFVIVADLVQRWAEYKALPTPQAEIEFDAWMRQQIYHGRVHILETHAGQPRLGRGLYGDETARKIRIEIIET